MPTLRPPVPLSLLQSGLLALLLAGCASTAPTSRGEAQSAAIKVENK